MSRTLRPSHPLGKTLFLTVCVFVAAWLLGLGLAESDGIDKMTAAHERLTERVGRLNQEITLLQREKERAQSDPNYFRLLAREQFNMVESGEVVFILRLPDDPPGR